MLVDNVRRPAAVEGTGDCGAGDEVREVVTLGTPIADALMVRVIDAAAWGRAKGDALLETGPAA
jgi:hypothetical protein